jgi:hypothetical protein
MSAIAPNPKKLWRSSDAEIEAAQISFDWLVKFQTKKLLSTAEAAECIGRGQDFVRRLASDGRLEAFGDSAFGERETLVISRRSVVVYMARTAKSDPDLFLTSFLDVAQTMSAIGKTKLIAALQMTLR